MIKIPISSIIYWTVLTIFKFAEKNFSQALQDKELMEDKR